MATSSDEHSASLHGSCACARNQYTIILPHPPTPNLLAHITLSQPPSFPSPGLAPHQTPHLRVPLAWYHSTTYSHFPDETHAAIRRTFESGHDRQRMQFCGFCGTHLTVWSEGEGEGEWMGVSAGTLGEGSWEMLKGLGVVGGEEEEVDENEDEHEGVGSGEGAIDAIEHPQGEGREMAKGDVRDREDEWSADFLQDRPGMGRRTWRRGGYRGRDGRLTVTWEVMEIEGEEEQELPVARNTVKGGDAERREAKKRRLDP